MNILYTVNPRHKRKSAARHSRRHRSAAQRAATARLLAFNRARRGGGSAPRRRRRSSHAASMSVNPRRRRRSRSFRRNPSRAASSMRRMFSGSGVGGMLQNGAIMGGGAVAVDIAMGYASSMLPATMVSPVNTDGTANWGYFGAKTALALAIGMFGRKLPVVGKYAPQMAEGALAVMAYQLMRPMVPASIALGYLNPTPTMRPVRRVAGVGKYVSGGMGAYFPAVRAGGGVQGRGASAAQVVSIVARRDRTHATVAGR